LPEVAENFIHRVGRTGRAGNSGIASTLFAREQRSELHQLERTLGIKMERMGTDVASANPEKDAHRSALRAAVKKQNAPRRPADAPKSRMVRLPGEVLQMV
jgi:ATP-dependent RNA helicase DeaD